jgi:hypothetical protein
VPEDDGEVVDETGVEAKDIELVMSQVRASWTVRMLSLQPDQRPSFTVLAFQLVGCVA